MDHLPLMLRLVAAMVLKKQCQVLLAEIAYLRAENGYYRQQLPPKRLTFTMAWKRRFAETGAVVGWARLKDICTIASIRTVQRWKNLLEKGLLSVTTTKQGRPRVAKETEDLVLKMSKENPSWGAVRIVGELDKLEIVICARTVSAIWKRHGMVPPDPQRRMKESNWKPFIAGHDHEIVATDFFTADVWGWLGKRTVYVLFFIHLQTRRVHIAGITENPDEAFMKQTARNDTMADVGWLKEVGAKYLIHDRDTKYCESWKTIVTDSNVETLALPANSPDLNAYAERWVRSIKVDCIRRLTILGVSGLRRAVREYVEFYNAERPHQSMDNAPLGAQPPAQKLDDGLVKGPIRCRERCGGVLKHYYREAA